MQAEIINGICHWPIYLRKDTSDSWDHGGHRIVLCPTETRLPIGQWAANMRAFSQIIGIPITRIANVEMIIPVKTGNRQPCLGDCAWGITLKK